MKGGRHFDMTLPWEDGKIRVTGHVTRYYPAVMHLANGDPGYPAEGGEVEDLKIFACDGTEMDDSDGAIFRAIEDDIYEAVSEADCGPDPDAAYDAMRAGD